MPNEEAESRADRPEETMSTLPTYLVKQLMSLREQGSSPVVSWGAPLGGEREVPTGHPEPDSVQKIEQDATKPAAQYGAPLTVLSHGWNWDPPRV